MLGVTHAELGMMLLKKWMFPENLVSAVGFHHHPRENNNNSIFPIIINTADLLVHYAEKLNEETSKSDILDNIIYPEILSLFKNQGLDWNEAVFENYKDELNKQKEAAGESISLLLS